MQTALLIAGTTLAFCAAAVLMVLAYLALKLLGEISREAFRPAAQTGPGHTPPRPLPRPSATGPNFVNVAECKRCGTTLVLDTNELAAQFVGDCVGRFHDRHSTCGRQQQNKGV
jgi:hypothetical protein